jgi:hypothetical protein
MLFALCVWQHVRLNSNSLWSTAWPSVLQEGKEDKCLSVGWQASPTTGSSSGLQWQAQRCSLVGGYVCQRRIQGTREFYHFAVVKVETR